MPKGCLCMYNMSAGYTNCRAFEGSLLMRVIRNSWKPDSPWQADLNIFSADSNDMLTTSALSHEITIVFKFGNTI